MIATSGRRTVKLGIGLSLLAVALSAVSLAVDGGPRLACVLVSQLIVAPAALDQVLVRFYARSALARIFAFLIDGIVLVLVAGALLSLPGWGITRAPSALVPPLLALIAVVATLLSRRTVGATSPSRPTSVKPSLLVVAAIVVATAAGVLGVVVAVRSERSAINRASPPALSVNGPSLCAGSRVGVQVVNASSERYRYFLRIAPQRSSGRTDGEEQRTAVTTIDAETTRPESVARSCGSAFLVELLVRRDGSSRYTRSAILPFSP